MKSFLRLFAFLCSLTFVLLAPANITNQTARLGPFVAASFPANLSVTFPFQSSSDLLVLNLGQSGTSNDPPVVLTLNSDYTVTGGGYNSSYNMQGGTVIVVSTGAHSVQANDQIVILRNVPVNQIVGFTASGTVTPQMLERAFDKTATISQQLTETSSRALRFEAGETLDGTLIRDSRAGKYLGFDSTGAITYLDGGSGGGGGTTYTAGTGLLLASDEFSVNPVQSLTTLTVTNPITGSVTGNAATATALATARAINGVNFDGTAAITVTAAAGTLTGATLAPNVLSSSLTSVGIGTLGAMALQAPSAVNITGGSIDGATVTGLAAPSAGSDAANKDYVDSISAGIVPRSAVVAATTANITLSAPQTIDGQAVIAGNRVLVKNQTAPAENGIYDVAAGAWSRSSDSNTAGELLFGYYYFVSSGTTNGATSWFIQTAPTTLGVDPVAFAQFSASQNYTAGTGLTLSGSQFSINSTQTSLAISGSTFNGTLGLTTPAAAAFTTQTTTGNSYMANLVIKGGQLNETATNAVASVDLNYDGYGGGTSQFRNVIIYDGKNAEVARFTGSTKALVVAGDVSAKQGAFSDTSGTVSVTSSTGTNRVALTFVNTGGTYYNGIDSSTGASYGGTAYALIRFAPSGRVIQDIINSAPITTISSTGLAVTGAYSINSNANLRTTKTNFHLTINVKDYGAVGDGATNDTAAINSAIAALTNYSTLYFPAGNYLITAGSVTGLTGLSYVKIHGDGARLYSSATGATGNFLVVDATCSNIQVDGLGFVGSATVRGNGIGIRMYADNSSITNCYISGTSDFAILIGDTTTYADRVVVANNVINAPLGDGIHVSAGRDVTITGNVMVATGDDGIGIIADDATGPPSRITITGNHIYNGSSAGIRVNEADDVLLSDNTIHTTVAAGIDVARFNSTTAYNDRVHVKGNKVYNSTTTGGPRAAIWMNYCNESSVTDNEIYDITNGAGICLLDFNDMTVRGNVIRGTASRAIVFDDSTTTNVATAWTDLSISANVIQSVTANEAIYLVPASGITLTGAVVTGNDGIDLPAGNWIYYDRLTTAKVGNNTSLDGRTVAGGGTTSGVTTFNNN